MQSINRNRPPENIRQQLDLSRIIAEKQQEVATGRKIEQPSDNPASWLEISNIARLQSDESAWVSNIGRARARSSSAETSLTAVSNGLVRMQELLIQSNNETISAADRETIAIEIEGLLSAFQDSLAVQDSFGGAVFQDGDPIEVPINENIRVVSSPSIQTVTDNISIGGGATSDFQTIITNIIAAVRSGTSADRSANLEPLQETQEHLNNLIAQQGIIGNRLDSAKEYLDANAIDLAERRSALEDTDLTETISKIQSLLVNLQAAQAVYSQIEQRSLFDLLR